MRILDALNIPKVIDLDEFIISLDESDPERVNRNLRQFELPENVKKQLDKMLTTMGERVPQGRDIGRFVYGTFGSGKSHLMSVVGKMLERDETVYDVGVPGLSELRANHPWLDKQSMLVVRLNMMGKSTLVHALYDAFNRALEEQGKPTLGFTDEQRVFDLIERDAERMGGMDVLLAQLVEDEVIPSAKFYERGLKGDLDKQLDLAAKLQTWRDHGEEPVRPEDLFLPEKEGFERICRHAKEQGYTGIGWLIDELIIWIRGKGREEYVQQINALSSLVDHDAKESRSLPMLVLVAVQQDIVETCPEDVSEQGFRQHLGFISNRFQPMLILEDEDLYEVAAQRVLKPKPDQAKALADAVDRTFKKHDKAIKALSGELDPKLVRRLYPFHPALLRVLVDVTQALSRSRSAIAALYALLKNYPELEVGDFIPLGALYDVIFTSDNIESVKKRTNAVALRFVAASEAYEKLKPQIDETAAAVGGDPNELHQLVKTVLLCQLSERRYFPNGRSLRDATLASTLFRLNLTDVRALVERTGISKVANYFSRLASSGEMQVQLVGDERDPKIIINTEQVDPEQVLSMARADLVHADRFAYCRKLIDDSLGLKLGTRTDATRKVSWRGTERPGRLRLCNVRRLSYAGQQNEFDPRTRGGSATEFLVLVDYPFDEDTSRDRKDDVEQVQRARSRKRQWTLAWLPRHFTDDEKSMLDNAAAIERVREDQRRYLSDYAPRDAQSIARALEGHQANLEAQLQKAVNRVYFREGEIHPLSDQLEGLSQIGGRDPGKAIDELAREVLDHRYPQHPVFGRRVRTRELGDLAEWAVRAALTGQPQDLRKSEMETVSAYGLPLEIVYTGPSSITHRIDGRFLRAIKDWAVRQSGPFKASSLRAFLTAEGNEGFGFTDEVVRFFLFYLLQVEGYEAVVKGQSKTVDGLRSLPADFELVKADVVKASVWEKATDVATKLLRVDERADLPSVPEQAKLSRDCASKARRLADEVRELETVLGEALALVDATSEDSARAKTYAELRSLLKSVAAAEGSAACIRAVADIQGREDLDALVKAAQNLSGASEALETIRGQDTQLGYIKKNGSDEDKKKAVITARNLLNAPVTRALQGHVDDWLKETKTIFQRLLEESGGGKDRDGGNGSKTGDARAVRHERTTVKRSSVAKAVGELVAAALEESDAKSFDVTLVLTPRDDA